MIGKLSSSSLTQKCARFIYTNDKETFSNEFIEGCNENECFTECSKMKYTSYIPTTGYVFKAQSPGLTQLESFIIEGYFYLFDYFNKY